MKSEYIETVVSCDNCSSIIVTVEGSLFHNDYDYSPHDNMDECAECHEICIEYEQKEQEVKEKEQKKMTIIIPDGKDADLDVFL